MYYRICSICQICAFCSQSISISWLSPLCYITRISVVQYVTCRLIQTSSNGVCRYRWDGVPVVYSTVLYVLSCLLRVQCDTFMYIGYFRLPLLNTAFAFTCTVSYTVTHDRIDIQYSRTTGFAQCTRINAVVYILLLFLGPKKPYTVAPLSHLWMYSVVHTV